MTPDDLITDVLRREGGSRYTDHPNDRGGPTRWGITQATLSAWRGHPVGPGDVRDLTEGEARDIYRYRYLTGPRIDTLPPTLVAQVFDMAVNHGPSRAVKILQAALGVPQDGKIGPMTLAAAQRAVEPVIHDSLALARAEFYRGLVAADPKQGVFLKGWLQRAAEFASADVRPAITEMV